MRITDSLLRSFRIARTYPNSQTVNCLDFTQNGESAVSSSDDDCIVIYDIRIGKYVEFEHEDMLLLLLCYTRRYGVINYLELFVTRLNRLFALYLQTNRDVVQQKVWSGHHPLCAQGHRDGGVQLQQAGR